MISLCILPSFADSEEDKILEAAKKGTVLYEIFGGSDVSNLYVMRSYRYGTNEYSQFVKTHNDLVHPFIDEMLVPSNEITVFEVRSITWPRREWLGFETICYKLGPSVQSKDAIIALCSKYLKDFEPAVIQDIDLVKNEEGYYSRLPDLITYEDELYLSTGGERTNLAAPIVFFEGFTVKEYDEKTATVIAPAEEDYCSINAPNLSKTPEYTIELVKEDGEWKICGGTLFSEFYVEHLFLSYKFSPEMGEDFSLITHTLLISASAVLMAVLVKGRKRKEA